MKDATRNSNIWTPSSKPKSRFDEDQSHTRRPTPERSDELAMVFGQLDERSSGSVGTDILMQLVKRSFGPAESKLLMAQLPLSASPDGHISQPKFVACFAKALQDLTNVEFTESIARLKLAVSKSSLAKNTDADVMFDRLDQNKDGVIDRAEFAAAYGTHINAQ